MWKELLVNFDYVLCKTKYCYEIFKEFVPEEKLKLVLWQSSERGTSGVDKDRNKIMLMHTDPFSSSLQPIIDAWKLDYPELNIVIITDIPKNVKKRNLANINYITNISAEKFNILFNKCMIHLCLSNIDNFNHNANQAQMSKCIPVIVKKGPSQEIVNPDGHFGVSCNKKKNTNFLGSRYSYNEDSVTETLEKIFNTSLTTLEIMCKNGAEHGLRNKMRSTEFLVPLFQEITDNAKKPKIDEVPEIPKLSIVTHVRNMKKMFKLAVINYRTTTYSKKEWIIIDTSDEDQIVKDQLPPEEMWEQFNIKYIREDSSKSIGYLLNRAVEETSNDLVMIMQPDDFFYQNGITKLVQNLILSGKDCVGMTSYGCFHISRYISIVNIVPLYIPYYNRIYPGSLCFKKSFWEEGKFSEDGTLMKPFLENRTNDFSEIYYENIMIGLIHNLNQRGNIPDNQDSNGCHFNLSKKVFEFVCSLETEEKKSEEEKEETEDTTENVNSKEVKEI